MSLARWLLPLLLACGGNEVAPVVAPTVPVAPAKPAAPVADQVRVAVLGDSLAAGMGLPADQAFPMVLQSALRELGHPVIVLNAGVSGDTTAGGLRRLDWILGQSPDVLVVELGANDAMRGQPVSQTEANLRGIIQGAQAKGVKVLLLGMWAPPNMGEGFTEDFKAIYPRLSQEFGVPLLPFLLENVAGKPELNQADGIHPTAEGHVIMAEAVLPLLAPLVEQAAL